MGDKPDVFITVYSPGIGSLDIEDNQFDTLAYQVSADRLCNLRAESLTPPVWMGEYIADGGHRHLVRYDVRSGDCNWLTVLEYAEKNTWLIQLRGVVGIWALRLICEQSLQQI